MDCRCRKADHAFFQNKAANWAHSAAFADFFGPDHKHIGNRAVADPHLGAAELIAAGYFLRARHHALGVRAVVGLGQAKAADQSAGGQLGQVFLALRLGAEFKNRQHHQRALHAHHRAVTAVYPLHFAGDQAIGYVIEGWAAIGFRNRRPQQAQLAHFAEDGRVRGFMAKGLRHAGLQFVLAIRGGGIAHHALFVTELCIQQKRVVPEKSGMCHAGSKRG